MAQQVKNFSCLQETQETQVLSLGQEDTLKKEMATLSSILAWGNSMDREASWATVQGFAKSQTQLIKQVSKPLPVNVNVYESPFYGIIIFYIE